MESKQPKRTQPKIQLLHTLEIRQKTISLSDEMLDGAKRR